MNKASMIKENNSRQRVQVFVPFAGATLTSPYTTVDDEVIITSIDMDITIDGVTVTYLAGSVIGLSQDVIYTLAGNLPVHKM